MTNYVATLVHLVPNAKVRYKGNDNPYNEIAWLDERPQPTQAECDSAWPQVEYEIAFAEIQGQRASRYESEIGYSFFDSVDKDTDLTDLVSIVEAIKAELPYPTAPAAS
jgi:adenosine/AMP kinase